MTTTRGQLVFILTGIFFLSIGCGSLPKQAYWAPSEVEKTDYSDLANWASHPDKSDPADKVPGQNDFASQEHKMADVFFVHPTTYTGRLHDNQWNARLDDEDLNEHTDQSTILFQASIFNDVGRIFSPRYRQAHLHSFYTKDHPSGLRALDFAYADVKAAFEYYLKEYNKGRPIIIAGHSQGTHHAKTLVKEFFDNQELSDQLVVAYLVGMPVKKDYFNKITPCASPDQTNCFVSWRTYKKDHLPDEMPIGDEYVVVNPLTWDVNQAYASKDLHKGAVLRNFNKIYKNIIEAQIYKGILWVSKPKFAWSFLFTRNNYHIADYNFFYYNVQENANNRLSKYLGD